ncbi:transposase [Pseudoxanthomonas winnipegensis]|nr:transposase [Pseudoxanthomonas winnipegensis]
MNTNHEHFPPASGRLDREMLDGLARMLPRARGNAAVPAWRVLAAVLHVRRSGCAWNRLPPEYGPWHTLYTRARRWQRRGLLAPALEAFERGRYERGVPPAPDPAARRRMEVLADSLRPLVFSLAGSLRDERGDLRISQLEVATLMMIEQQPGIGVTPLAKRMEVHPASMSLLLRGLAGQGWIQAGERDPADRRRAWLTIAEAGRQVLRKVRSNRSDQLVRQFLRLPAEELAALEAVLPILQRIGEQLLLAGGRGRGV